MELNNYQDKASRTITKDQSKNNALNEFALGLAGECGEVVEIIKKYLYHDHELSYIDIKKELGDVLWYLACLCFTLKIPLEEVAKLNIMKLKKRYPNGFNKNDSVNRKI